MNRDIIIACGYCHKEETVTVDANDFHSWLYAGVNEAKCFPYLTPEQQLLLLTCFCPTCPQLETDAHPITD